MDETRLAGVLARVDEIGPVIRAGAAESERLGRLTPAVLEALRGAGLFQTLIPTELGGLGLTIPESTAVFERVATFDASTGWTLTVLADGPLFARFLNPDAFRSVCGDPPDLIATSLNPTGVRAERVDGGYRFSGTATYLSGSAHAQWIATAAIVTEGGEPAVSDLGIDIRAGFLPIGTARSLENWNVTGMRATGSSDYEFRDVFVASDWTFEPLRPGASGAPEASDVFSAIPLWAQLGGGLAANAVGAAHNMIERFIELAGAKVPVGAFMKMAERPPTQIALGEAQGLTQAAHAVLHHAMDEVWARGAARAEFDNVALARQRLGSVTAVRLAAQAIDLLHDAAGMSAVTRDAVLERCWRDVHTITQHTVLAPARFEITGRVLLGLDPGSPVI